MSSVSTSGVVDERRPAEGPALLLTAEEAARLLSVSRSRIYEWIQTGELPSVTLGRSRRVTRRALEAFVAERESAGDAA